MWAAILKYLKAAAKKALTQVAQHPVKSVLSMTPAGQAVNLYDAFKGQMDSAGAKEKQSPTTQKPEQSSVGTVGGGGGMGGAGQGILAGLIGQSGVGGNQGQNLQTYQPDRTPIPFDPQKFSRLPMNQGGIYQPLPPSASIVPPNYMKYGLAQQFNNPASINQPITPYYGNSSPQQGLDTPTDVDPNKVVGGVRGFLDSITGQPLPENFMKARQGRRTAYALGGIIPNVIMSKLGQPSPAEATTRNYQNQFYQSGSPAYDPSTLTPGQMVPARGVPIKKETPSEKKYNQELDFNASLKDWASGAVDDATAYKMMSENFPDEQDKINKYYFMKTGIFPMGRNRR